MINIFLYFLTFAIWYQYFWYDCLHPMVPEYRLDQSWKPTNNKSFILCSVKCFDVNFLCFDQNNSYFWKCRTRLDKQQLFLAIHEQLYVYTNIEFWFSTRKDVFGEGLLRDSSLWKPWDCSLLYGAIVQEFVIFNFDYSFE